MMSDNHFPVPDVLSLAERFAMRSTRASAAVARLNERDPDHRYSLGMTASGLFHLLRTSGKSAEKISDDLPLDEFVAFANRTGPQKKVRVSKFDVAFEKQLGNKNREG
jgi:hypothetical protein